MTWDGQPGVSQGYLHGYSKTERDRLYRQAAFLEDTIFRDVVYPKSGLLLETGCGVGAQTGILCRRFPELRIDSVDVQDSQLKQAASHLEPEIRAGRVALHHSDAASLPFPEASHDGAFICWFLEHLPDPLSALREIRRVLKLGAPIYCSEVMNSSLFVHPRVGSLTEYWDAYNAHQCFLKGDPFVGAKLGTLLQDAGYRKINVEGRTELRDRRDPAARDAFLGYWTELLLSGVPALLEAGKVQASLVERLKRELALVRATPDAVFSYTWYRARAQA